MVVRIGIEELFYGFIHNYRTFGIRSNSKNTKWTHKILGYFASLGQMLGFIVDYEWGRYDLVWFYDLPEYEEGEPWLHIEHENSSRRLSNLLRKTRESEFPSVLAIGYPNSPTALKKFVMKLEELHHSIDKEFMFILDPAYYESDGELIRGYVARPRLGSLRELEAQRFVAPDGSYYATWMESRDAVEEE